MAVTKAKKSVTLTELHDKFTRAKAVYFADYRGLTVKKVGDLRKKLHKAGVDYMVAKKTLYKIALKNSNLPEAPEDVMAGPVGAAFGYDDIVVPIKIMHEFTKDPAVKFVILGGLVDGKFISKSEAKAFAMLPSREQLLANLVGSIKAPIAGLHLILVGILRQFVYGLAAVRDKKQAG